MPSAAYKTNLAISAATPATQDAAGYAALTFTRIANVDKLGPLGPTFGEITFQPLDDIEQTFKGPLKPGSLNPGIALDPSDAGQALLQTAADDETQKIYSIRVILSNGEKRYFGARVFGMPEQVDGAETLIMASPTIKAVTKTVKVAAA